MKYCKKCFRNVREDVNVCPYCGAPGLEEYGSHTSGEDFTCSQPKKAEREIKAEIDSLSPHKEDDAYSRDAYSPFSMFDDESTTDAYGNTKKRNKDCNDTEYDAYGSKTHSTAECKNAPDIPDNDRQKTYGTNNASGTVPDPGSQNYKMRIEYLNMLKKINGISKERIDELMRRYDETHGNAAVKNYTHTYTSKNTATGQFEDTGAYIATVIGIIFGFFNPFLGIIILNIVRGKLKTANEKTRKTAVKLINTFTVIFILMLIGYFIVLGSASLFSDGGVLNV